MTKHMENDPQSEKDLQPMHTLPFRLMPLVNSMGSEDGIAWHDPWRIQPKAIIGNDDRKPVSDLMRFPYASIGLIHAFRNGERGARTLGTCWLAWNHRIVTAAHVVYNPFDLGGQADRVHVWLGYDRHRNDNPAIVATRIHIHPRYVATGDRRYDIALIDFDAMPFARQPFAVYNHALAKGNAILIAGYPSDYGGLSMVMATGRAVEINPWLLRYDADTNGGQSGAPVLVVDDDGTHVIGMHVAMEHYAQTTGGPVNLGVHLGDELIGWINKTS